MAGIKRSVYMSEAEWAAMDAAAKKQDRSAAWIIRNMLRSAGIITMPKSRKEKTSEE